MNSQDKKIYLATLEKNIIYNNDNIAIIDQLGSINTTKLPPIKLDTYIAILCLKGEISVIINNNLCTARSDDMFICHPNQIIKAIKTSQDFEGYGFGLTQEYINQIFPISFEKWTWEQFIDINPVLALKEEERDVFCQYYNLLKSKLTKKTFKHQKEIIDALLQAFVFEFQDCMEHIVQLSPAPFNSASNLFKSFLELLSSSYPKERSVKFYADKLYVSPKYLSSVCKETCGETASVLIKKYVAKDIEYLLKCREKSIKEISNELKFSNLSFFGKYVKNLFGISPKLFREKLQQKH